MERLSGEEHSSLHLESDDVRLGGDSEHDGVALLDRGDGRLHPHRWPLQLLRSQNGHDLLMIRIMMRGEDEDDKYLVASRLLPAQ